MIIKYYIKEHFGVQRMYIADAKQAQAFYRLTQRKIILTEHIEALKALGIILEPIDHENK